MFYSKGDILEKKINNEFFRKLLHSKTRSLRYTTHSIERAVKRKIINKNEKTIPRFEKDIGNKDPHLAVEQTSEFEGERKFKLYYRAPEGGFIAYILALNKQMRLISVYKTTKSIQEKLYKHEKAIMKKR